MRIALVLLLWAATLPAATLRAGLAKVDITPRGAVWMSGYAARTHPSEGVLNRLWAKALAIESSQGGRIVIISTDLVGIPRDLSDQVAARLKKQFGLNRSQLLINASHTHTGPIVWPNLRNLTVLPGGEQEKLIDYRKTLDDALVSTAASALRDLSPATIDFGEGSAGFAMNRRAGINPNGPVDHRVPVLKIADTAGKIRGIVFGYACHNTTLTGEFYQLSGDYAGFAAEAIEQQHPGATALFVTLCGADQNPNPRSTLELARQHGNTLAGEVEKVIAARMTPVSGPVRTAFRMAELRFAARSRQDFEAELKSKVPAQVRRGEMMLKELDAGRKLGRLDYPLQAVRFGKSLTLLALGGEVTVDYGLRARREYSGEPLITAGYSNDVMSYIPSVRVLREGGYEAVDSMFYYAQPGPFVEDVEERVFAAIRQVMKSVGR
ncbi:MAG TPA: neutral/alkaline non-lysosomal ceramidase N-terminal domain-containing protein [Candidatus Solibacter sp.]|nr:neutral/alkaline non-lysosomal ceramidase N-terminal domain-containing protein [Candidatus Solibacter sp.]